MNNVQKAGPASSCTQKTTKRNLSTSSTFPSQNDKKPKVYASPNLYALLYTYDTDDKAPTLSSTNLKDDPVNQPHTERDIGPPAPPIYIKNIVNYSTFSKLLKTSSI